MAAVVVDVDVDVVVFAVVVVVSRSNFVVLISSERKSEAETRKCVDAKAGHSRIPPCWYPFVPLNDWPVP